MASLDAQTASNLDLFVLCIEDRTIGTKNAPSVSEHYRRYKNATRTRRPQLCLDRKITWMRLLTKWPHCPQEIILQHQKQMLLSSTSEVLCTIHTLEAERTSTIF